MTVRDAAYRVLEAAGEPLHFTEISSRVLAEGFWTTQGKTPQDTVSARLYVDIKENGAASRFRRTGRGMFTINRPPPGHDEPTPGASPCTTPAKAMSFTNAAETVLDQFGRGTPLHYRTITEKALELGLLKTDGATPEATMYAQILSEIPRQVQRGDTPRFVKHGKGIVGLSRWQTSGLAFQIDQHNQTVRRKLHERLFEMSPDEFETLMGTLLGKMGFEEVQVTKRTGDGGVDVRGTLVVGDVIRTRMAVQVKRWKNNVQAPVVQQVRGSLGAHEQGLIVTTSDFSAGARTEAEPADATPVALMNGDQLVKLLVGNDIGVARTNHYLIELEEGDAPA